MWIVSGVFGLNLNLYLAQLNAISGKTEQAMTALRNAASEGGLTCTHCLHNFPHYDSLRDDPAFNLLIADQEAKNAAQRQSLADDGMLLTPEQVLQLEEFSFDPFVY